MKSDTEEGFFMRKLQKEKRYAVCVLGDRCVDLPAGMQRMQPDAEQSATDFSNR